MKMGIKYRLARTAAGFNRQCGLGLVETLIAVAVLGSAVVAFVTGLSAGTLAVNVQDEQVTAQGLAQTQLEYTRSLPYDPEASAYPPIAAPDGYSLAVQVEPVAGADANLQKIAVTVTRDGESLLTVEGYKQNR